MNAFLLLAALAVGQTVAGRDTVPLYTDLGTFHHEITTDVPLAQAYFDQGMRLTFAFNHQEAIASFRYAAELDPSCAMCWWGVALALGPNINAPMPRDAALAAYDAIRNALGLLDDETPRERAYVEALATRYAADAPDARGTLDSAYARAMGDVVRRWPDDNTAATLFAEALMDLTPWDYWVGPDRPRPGTATLVSLLERVMAEEPDHPGACHYFIHAVERYHPDRAVACAERLAALMPGAGHLVHMPAHIYVRVGRYADAVNANHHAIHADERYVADRGRDGLYQVIYYPHNYHFLSFAAMLAGQAQVTMTAAAALEDDVPVEVAVEFLALQELYAYLHLARVAFGRFDDVLSMPMPDPTLRQATGLAWYARGLAAARTGDDAQRDVAIDMVARIMQGIAEEPFHSVLGIAHHILLAEAAFDRGANDEGVRHLNAAVALEDGLSYMEPPYWHKPVRHMLGFHLLRLGRLEEAEQAYRQDLERFPLNGWSLAGLAQVLERQGRAEEATATRHLLEEAWAASDVTPRHSTY